MKTLEIQSGVRLKPLIRCYESNRVRSEAGFGSDGGDLIHEGSCWSCVVDETPIPGEPDGVELIVEIQLVEGRVESAGVALVFELDDWSAEDYVLMPAAVYAGNRFAMSPLAYPPLWRERADFSPTMPTTITDLPRLSQNGGVSRIELTTGDMATPCVGVRHARNGRGRLFLTTQGSIWGNHGITLEESSDRQRARILISAPAVRENFYRPGDGGLRPSTDKGVTWKPGDGVTIRVRLYEFPALTTLDLFERFATVRKAMAPPHEVKPQLPWSAAWAIQERKYNAENWDESLGYYRMAPDFHTTFSVCDEPLCFLWQCGWVGGGMVTHPLLGEGGEVSRQRAWRNLEMLFERTQAGSGFFYGLGDGVRFYSDGFDKPHPWNMHMIRKSADVLLFAIKQFDLISRQGKTVPVLWETSARRVADAFVTMWKTYGQFGQFVDVETGKMCVGGSTSAAAAPGALALAAQYFKEKRYQEVAQAAAKAYYERDVKAGVTTGGPGEILSAPDSESAYSLFESFVLLHEVTAEAEWLVMARDMLRQLASWVVSYDYVFPPDSILGRAGVRTTGAVWANVQNKHAAPAICTASGDALLKYWRASGDALAVDLLGDIVRGLPQYLSRADRRLGERMKPGWMCERVNLSDWEGPEGVGGNLFGSCWAEVSLMLTRAEVPGLYVQPDAGVYFVFDQIEAELVGKGEGWLELRLGNPTAFDAEVRVLCETPDMIRRPLGLNALHGCRVIALRAGQQAVYRFDQQL